MDFCQKFQERLGARVPLFTVLLVLQSTNENMKENRKNIIPLDGISFPDLEILWFASKTNSKPGIQPHHETDACSAYQGRWIIKRWNWTGDRTTKCKLSFNVTYTVKELSPSNNQLLWYSVKPI